MSFKRTLCQHCRKRLEQGQRIHEGCIEGFAAAQEEKAARTQAKKVKAARAKEKAEFKERKEKLKGLPELKKEAQIAFNAFIRGRDKHLDCISCGKPASTDYGFQNGRDCGHFRSVGAAPHLRYNEDNAHAQCVRCNQWKAGNVVDYRIRLIERIGQDRVTALETDNEPRKWTRGELTEIKAKYRRKLKELKEKE